MEEKAFVVKAQKVKRGDRGIFLKHREQDTYDGFGRNLLYIWCKGSEPNEIDIGISGYRREQFVGFCSLQV
jgi:hypothetical protein